MRLTLLVTSLLLGTALVGLAPSAHAAPPCWYAADKVECIQDQTDVCVYGCAPECIIYNPCNPIYCDPWWP